MVGLARAAGNGRRQQSLKWSERNKTYNQHTHKHNTKPKQQVQYSLLDQRPAAKMAAAADARGIKILAYGTLLGGFFSERWLGQPEPKAFETVSQQKASLSVCLPACLSVCLPACASAMCMLFRPFFLGVWWWWRRVGGWVVG